MAEHQRFGRMASSGQRGSALVPALIAVLAVSAMSAGLLQLSSAVTRRQQGSAATSRAFYLAEAGLVEAYTGLAIAKTGNVGSQAAPAVFGDGLFWVEATENADGTVTLESTGMYGAGRATLSMVVEPIEITLSSLGFATSDDLKVNPDTLLDSFDSEQGSYASQVGTKLNNMAIVGSNGDVSIASGDMVYGDVVPGETGTATISAGAIVTGSVTPRSGKVEFPPIEVPAIASLPAFVHSGVVPLTIPPGEVGYDSITIEKYCTLILKGPLTLVVGDFILLKDGEVSIDTTDGPVDIFVTGDLDLKASSLVTTGNSSPSDVTFMVSSSSTKSVSFGSDSEFHGFIYAPNADIHIAAKFEIFGGVVGKSLNLAAQGKMHYDLSLDPTREGVLPRFYSWRIVDIPTNIAANRSDPFAALGVDPATLLHPADAHEDQTLNLSYLNNSGLTVSFTGLESIFDWSQVDRVIWGTRDGDLFLTPGDVVKRAQATEDPNVALVSSKMTSKELAAALEDAAPVSDDALIEAAGRSPSMDPTDLEGVLLASGPSGGNPKLSQDVLLAAVASEGLDDSALASVLLDNSPLPQEVIDATLNKKPAMATNELDKVLAAQ